MNQRYHRRPSGRSHSGRHRPSVDVPNSAAAEFLCSINRRCRSLFGLVYLQSTKIWLTVFIHSQLSPQGGAPKIAKLVCNSNN